MIEDRWPAPGQRIGGRYLVDRLAARGGMGAVFRARDEVTGRDVALKVVWSEGASAARLNQEARVLADLQHPAIVRYLGHGECGPGLSFLAMDWLEGEDLSDRLAERGLGLQDSLAVARRLAEGLSVVHLRGLVHRDLKPSNVRLEAGDAGRAILIDFGVACSRGTDPGALAPRMTATGIVLGTVGYMSPEQATGEPDLCPRADVFALGCVLYECLTGEPAFSGVHVMAVLAKVLREQAPRVRDIRPDLPAALDELVARMLAKDRAARPANAAAVARELARIQLPDAGSPPVVSRRTAGLSAGEQRPVSVMLALLPGGADAKAESVVATCGGEWARLANGGLLVTLSGQGSTDEQVVTAAACALALRAAFPTARIGLSTGWGTATGAAPGSLIDRAAALLAGTLASGVRVDEVTAGLLGARFDARREGEAIVLLGRKADGDVPRTLLGREVPFVGRDREIDLLVATLSECAAESVARAAIVTGPCGQGKSRLARELLDRTRRDGPDALVLCARGDPTAPGSSLTTARRLVQQAASLREGLPEPEQRARLAAHVEQVCDASDVGWVVDFLCELLALPLAGDATSERFRAALSDPRMMGDGLRLAFGTWFAALAVRGPVVVVVDDLHWCDEPSISYLTDALRRLRTRPLLVVALGRPEWRATFPGLWEAADRTEVVLPRLAQRAAERLVRAALGPSATDAAVARIVERADGNALYAEELVRHVVAGAPVDALPDTVVALAHSRIERLDPAARRVVRAASVFGDACWPRGLAALLGVGPDDRDLAHWLGVLVRAEVLEPAADSRFAGEAELVFRAGVLRDAAYATLTEGDRGKGHQLAGEWLESVGERDALRLAEHFDRSGDRRRGLAWWPRAATTALKAGGFEAAVRLCNRAKALDPEGAVKGRLLYTEGVALAMRGDLGGAADRLRAAVACSEPGTPRWFSCVATLLLTGTFLGDPTITLPLLGAVLDPAVRPEPSGAYGVSVYAASVGLAMIGQRAAAEAFLGRAEALAPDPASADPVFVVAIDLTRAALGLARSDLGDALRCLARARAITERTGNASGELLVTLHESAAFAEAGDEARCRHAADRLAQLATGFGASSFADWGTLSVVQARLAGGAGQELVGELSGLTRRLDAMFVTFARAMLAEACLAAGDLEAAERAAVDTCDGASMFPGAQAAALGTLARVALRRGDSARALTLADRGIDAAAKVGSPRDVSILLLARADALEAEGREAERAAALAAARERIQRIAAAIDEPGLRETYVTHVTANALTLARAG